MSDEELRRVLDRYFSQKVQLRSEEKQNALAVWEPVVKDILQYVTSKDPRFNLRKFPSGSYYERTKVKKPNEFDIMLEIESLKLGHWGLYDGGEDDLASYPPTGFTTVMIDQGEENTWRRDGCIARNGNLLSSTAIKSTFARLVNNAVEELNLRNKYRLREIYVNTSGPAVTLSISHANFRGSIAIDLTLAIQDTSWPEDAEDWKGKQRKGWPSQILVNEIVQGGCDLVAKKPKGSTSRDADYLWRYSFSRAEKKLFTKANTGAPGTCRRQLLRILKCLREDLQLTPLTTYHLKTIMFHEYEAFPSDADWGTNQMPARFKSAVGRLLKCLQQKSCPHYFIQNVNLFEASSFNDQRYQFLKEQVQQLLLNPCAVITGIRC